MPLTPTPEPTFRETAVESAREALEKVKVKASEVGQSVEETAKSGKISCVQRRGDMPMAIEVRPRLISLATFCFQTFDSEAIETRASSPNSVKKSPSRKKQRPVSEFPLIRDRQSLQDGNSLSSSQAMLPVVCPELFILTILINLLLSFVERQD